MLTLKRKKCLINLIFLFVSLVSVSCGPFRGLGIVDPELQPYLEEYKKEKLFYTGIKKIKNMHIGFTSLNGKRVGRCHRIGEYRQIEIDETFWAAAPEDLRLMVFFHEMGHCDLGRPHQDGVNLMNANLMSVSEFRSNRSFYIKKLFFPSSLSKNMYNKSKDVYCEHFNEMEK